MGPRQSTEEYKRFQYLDKKDVNQSKFIPITQKTTSLEKQDYYMEKQEHGPSFGVEGEYTGLTQFEVPQKYQAKMAKDPLKCQIPKIDGKTIYDPYLFKKSLNVYYGQWFKGQPHGYGKIYNPDRDFYYQGYFQQGLPSYYGVFLIDNIQFRGQIKHGRAQGQGKYKQKECIIQGQFKQNYPFKNCVQKNHNYIFKGDYENGRWKSGKLIWDNNKYSYEGQFLNGLMDGKGRLLTDDYTYDGEFKKGQKHGLGHIVWKQSKFYKGEFTQDEITGYGSLYVDQNLIYKGKFKKGQACGQGHILSHNKYYTVGSINGHVVLKSQIPQKLEWISISQNLKQDDLNQSLKRFLLYQPGHFSYQPKQNRGSNKSVTFFS